MISKLTSIISIILFLALSPLYVYAQSMNMSNTTSTTVYSNIFGRKSLLILI